MTGYKNPPDKSKFKKGDPRINRKGRPKSFDAWRGLNVSILSEMAVDKDGNPIIVTTLELDKDGNIVKSKHYATQAEMMVRSDIKDKSRRQSVVDSAFGKVPQAVDVTTGGEKINEVRIIEVIKTYEKPDDE
jgi:hypothetical protein